MSQNLPKHQRYSNAYRRFGYFWGLGVEHETYIATSQTRRITEFNAANMHPERYSVSYYRAYRPEPLRDALAETVGDVSGGTVTGSGLTVPVLMNCHSFTDADISGEHSTTYERVPKPNPRFNGTTLWEWATSHSPWLRGEYGRTFMWDGDTVEFMTQNFYCARVDDVLSELRNGHERFIAELNLLPREGVLATHGPLRLAHPVNAPWATYLTNPRGVAMFNNGTIHINVTLPTRLSFNRRPLFMRSFTDKHRRLARLIQWMEPLWVALYGSGDPLARGRRTGSRYAAGSQRLAVSRYIGLGTYDTVAMRTGKIVNLPRETVGPLPWYDWLHERTDYAPLDVIGMDISFQKHWAHGLEIRMFDQMSEVSLRAVLRDIVVLMDIALAAKTVIDPRRDRRWQRAAGYALYEGIGWRVSEDYLVGLSDVLGLADTPKEPRPVAMVMPWLRRCMESRRGACWRNMVGS